MPGHVDSVDMEPLIVVGVVGCLLYTCGRIASDITRRKGRSTSLGFALGFILGPLGILVAACQPKIDFRGKRRCIRCHRWIPERATSCPHCHTGMRVPSSPYRGPTVAGTSVFKRPPGTYQPNTPAGTVSRPWARGSAG